MSLTLLEPSNYDISYFDGGDTTYRHNAGYSHYKRWYRKDGKKSLGEFWKDKAKQLLDKYSLKGKKVLELGCAKGFIVEDLRALGVDAYGIDCSAYAISCAPREIRPYLVVGDVRTHLSTYAEDEFDVLFSLRLLECIPEANLPGLIKEMSRISKFQFHEIDEQANESFYLACSLGWWAGLKWPKGTLLVSRETKQEVVI